MAIRSIDLSIRGWFPDGRSVDNRDFLEPLGGDHIAIVRAEPSEAPAQAARLVFLSQSVAEPPLGKEEISDTIEKHALLITQWLREREPDVFARLRSSGLELDICVDIGIDGRELELKLPDDLLLESGRRALPIQWNVHDFRIDRD